MRGRQRCERPSRGTAQTGWFGRRRGRASSLFKVLAELVDTSEMHGRRTAMENPDLMNGRGPGEGSADELSAQIRRDTRDWRVARPTLILFMLFIGAGALLGALAFVLASDHQARSAMIKTTVIKTSSGWRVSNPDGLAQTDLTLNGHYLVWLNGGCLELLDLRSGHTTMLESASSDGSSAFPGVVSDRYVAWMANGDAQGTEINAYDLAERHPFAVSGTGDLGGTIALSHTVLCWDTADPTATDPNHMVIRARDLASGRTLTVAAGDVHLQDIAGDLVMWTQTFTKKARDTLVVKDLTSGRMWRLMLADRRKMFDYYLTGHSVVWASLAHGAALTAVPARIEALDLRSGRRRVVVEGPKVFGLAVSGGHILWMDRSQQGRVSVFMQVAEGGPVVPLKILGDDFSTLPVINGDTLAWTNDQGAGEPSEVVVMRMDK
jgi:hypothetical protein